MSAASPLMLLAADAVRFRQHGAGYPANAARAVAWEGWGDAGREAAWRDFAAAVLRLDALAAATRDRADADPAAASMPDAVRRAAAQRDAAWLVLHHGPQSAAA